MLGRRGIATAPAPVPSQAAHPKAPEELLRCSHCRHLLGLRSGADVVVLRQFEHGAAATIGRVDAISCDRVFATGKPCRGGWIHPERVERVRSILHRFPELGEPFAVMLARAS